MVYPFTVLKLFPSAWFVASLIIKYTDTMLTETGGVCITLKILNKTAWISYGGLVPRVAFVD